MKSEKYMIYYNETETCKKYVSSIYRGSTNETTDIGDAIEFDELKVALEMMKYLNRRRNNYNFKILCVRTTIEEVEPGFVEGGE